MDAAAAGAGGFFNAEQLRIFNATMNVTGQGVFSNFGSSKVFRHGENGQPGSAGGIVNLGDLPGSLILMRNMSKAAAH